MNVLWRWQDETLETEDVYYEVSETSIKDKSMLGTHGEELCDYVDVHWMIQTCDVPRKETSKFVSALMCIMWYRKSQ